MGPTALCACHAGAPAALTEAERPFIQFRGYNRGVPTISLHRQNLPKASEIYPARRLNLIAITNEKPVTRMGSAVLIHQTLFEARH